MFNMDIYAIARVVLSRIPPFPCLRRSLCTSPLHHFVRFSVSRHSEGLTLLEY